MSASSLMYGLLDYFKFYGVTDKTPDGIRLVGWFGFNDSLYRAASQRERERRIREIIGK